MTTHHIYYRAVKERNLRIAEGHSIRDATASEGDSNE